MPAAMQANGLAPDEPASRTVEVDAFCSWSACRMKMRSSARTSTSLTLYSSHGTENIMRMKFARVGELVARIHERLPDRVLVAHRHQRRQLGDQADRRDLAVVRVGDVERIVIERRQRADHADQHRHRMRVAAEAAEELAHLLVHHRVHA
mgnify:CR=1 FL=1